MNKGLLVLALYFLFLIPGAVRGQEFKPNLTQGVMKYQALRDTEIDPNAALREQGLKDWKQKRDTILVKAKKLLDQKDYTGVNQLLFPYDYLGQELLLCGAIPAGARLFQTLLRAKEKQRTPVFHWTLL
jgi:hypothetical protein